MDTHWYGHTLVWTSPGIGDMDTFSRHMYGHQIVCMDTNSFLWTPTGIVGMDTYCPYQLVWTLIGMDIN